MKRLLTSFVPCMPVDITGTWINSRDGVDITIPRT